MIILSSFNSDYLRNPLQFLIDQFIENEKIEINYGNIVTSLLELKRERENQVVTILFRLIDLINCTEESIDLLQLKKNLQLVIDTIDSVKNQLATRFVVILCPSLENKLPNLQFLEEYFNKEMHKKAIELIKVAEIQSYYSLLSIENKIGKETHIPYTPSFYIALSCFLARKLHNLITKPYKVIVVDCDDTLWQGVVGDIGAENVSFMEHHRLLQAFLIEKNKDGILICLCSKNDQKNVIDVFKKRSNDMLLTLENVSKFKINWQLKSENISQLAQDLNLGLDSFIFIDDSPFELEEVRHNLPEILCIQAPKNREEFFAIKDNWVFDSNIITEEDKNKTKLYREEESRQDYLSTFNNYIQFLQAINLSISINEVKENQEEIIKRISILSGKTNQFNLFPLPKDIADIKNTLKNNNVIFYVKAHDDFGDYGLIAVAFCQIKNNLLQVDSFFVSCRAFKKGIEYHLIKHIAQYAVSQSIEKINLSFKQTEKNTAAQGFITLLLQKFNDPLVDWKQIKNNKKASLSFSTIQLSRLEVNGLLEAQNNMYGRDSSSNAAAVAKRHVKEFLSKNNYLVKLQRITKTLTFLLNKFFFDEEKLLNLHTLEDKIVTLCHFLLGDIQNDIALTYLGLDSLKATELSYYLYQITKLDIPITLLLAKTTTLQSLITYCGPQQYKNDEVDGEVDCLVTSRQESQVISTSFQQKRIWLAEKKEINYACPSSDYMMIACFSVNNLNLPRFKRACENLIKKHDAFGFSFYIRNNELVQTILPAENRPLFFEVHPPQNELSVKTAILEATKKSFFMHEIPLIRFSVFVTDGSHKFYILLRIHHGIFDAISLQNTLSDLSDLYNKTTSNPRLDRFTYQYSEFVYYQQAFYNTENYQEEAKHYWSNVLFPLKSSTEFPYDKVSHCYNLAAEHPCKRYNFSIPHKDLLMLQQLAQSTTTTIFNLVSSLFSILVSAYTYEDKIGIITATNGRSSPMFHKVIGFFVNLIVLPFDLEKNISFFDYAKANYQIFLDSLAFQEFPFEKTLEIFQKQGIANILVNPALIYQSYKPAKLVLDGEQAVLEIPKKPILYDQRETCRFGAFSLFMQEESKEINCIIEYSESLYSDSFIQRIANNFIYLIHTICQDPHQKVHDISCVSKNEQLELLSFSKGPVTHYNEDLITIFQQQVFNYPDSIAISHNEMRLTYRELDNLSSHLANNLKKSGIGISVPVGLYFEKAYLFFIAELALLKLGAVFVPLSKADPTERLNYIIENAKLHYVIFDNNLLIKHDSRLQLIKISKQTLTNIDIPEKTYLLSPASLDSRICILYTSGSTGTPKGVILKQKGIVRVVKSANYIQMTPQDKVAQAANLAFDAAQLECWLAWTNGACLVIIDKELLLDDKLFAKKLSSEDVTTLWLTAALFHQYAYTKPMIFGNLKYLLAGGDIVEKKAIQEVFHHVKNDVFNFIIGYGPTETSIFATTCRITADILNDFLSMPIGRPVNNTEIRLFNRFNKLAPLGAKAHLAIGDDSLSEGYLNKPELQKERFIVCSESTLYLSGDQVRLSRIDNPQLLFCGRMDGEQLKKAGVLISLSEIEAALMHHPALKQVALVIKEAGCGEKKLIAFYIKNEKPYMLDKQHFSDYLRDKLPPFMWPDFYQEVDQFPTTPNGKIDKNALLLKLNFAAKNHLEILTNNQSKIMDLFRNVLSLPSTTEYRIGLDDSFFDWGGTSIIAMQLVYEIERLFGIRLSFKLLRQNPSIRSIDKILKSQMDYLTLEQNASWIVFQNGDESLAPIGFIHPAGGALYCYEDLIKKTLLKNVFFGIEDPVLSNGLPQNLSLEEMAKNYLLQIREKIKKPFILSGYSFGGMLALEIAAQLEEKQDNDLIGVVLIDTWIVSCASEAIQQQLKQEVLNYYTEVSRKIGETRKSLKDQLEQRYQYLQNLGFAFKPKKLKHTRVVLLKATMLGSSFENMASESKNNYLLDFVNDKLFHCTPIPGTHYTILEQEYVDSTAKVFSDQVMALQKHEFDTVKKGGNMPLCFFKAEKNNVTTNSKPDVSRNYKLS